MWIGASMAVIAIVSLVLQFWVFDTENERVLNRLFEFIGLLSTLMVTVAVLIVAVRRILLDVQKETFETVLRQGIQSWTKRNYPLITVKHDAARRMQFFMLTDHEHIFECAATDTDVSGWGKVLFADLPPLNGYNKGDILKFHLAKEMWVNRSKIEGYDLETLGT